MAVRVRLRVEAGGRVREVVALVNSGYEADTPQLMVPIGLARELGLWPPPSDAREEFVDTAGGPVRVWVYAFETLGLKPAPLMGRLEVVGPEGGYLL